MWRARIGVAAMAIGASGGPAPAPDLLVLVANVGNLDMLEGGPCADWPARGALCTKAHEDAVAEQVRAIRPDVAVLMEVLDPSRCEDGLEVCGGEASVRRLVGDGYTILCDAIGGYDCLAVRDDIPVDGCGRGERCVAETPPQPDACVGIGDFSSVSRARLVVRGRDLDVVVMHPYQAVNDDEDRCRAAQVQQAFDLAGEGAALLAGDVNYDPYRLGAWFGTGEVWARHVGRGRRFAHHGAGRPLPETTWLGALTMDHVVSDGLLGTCRVRDLGVEGLDHRALVCPLRWRGMG